MFNLADKFAGAKQTGVEAFRTLVDTALDGISQLAALSLHTARSCAARGADQLGALSEISDLQGLMAWQTPLAAAACERSIAYSRRVYEICCASSSVVAQVVESQLGGLGGGCRGRSTSF